MADNNAIISKVTKILDMKKARIVNLIIPEEILNDDSLDTIEDESSWEYEIIVQKKENGLIKFSKKYITIALVWVVFTGTGIEDWFQGYTKTIIESTTIKISEFIKSPPIDFSDSDEPYNPYDLQIYKSYATSGAPGEKYTL